MTLVRYPTLSGRVCFAARNRETNHVAVAAHISDEASAYGGALVLIVHERHSSGQSCLGSPRAMLCAC